MAANAIDQTRRMLSLVTYLRERPGARVGDVARAFGVTEDELISDLDVLPLCGTSFRGGDLLDIDTDGERIWWHNVDDVAQPLRLAADEATAVVIHAQGAHTAGAHRFETVTLLVTAPWRGLRAVCRGIGHAFAWFPLVRALWALRGVVGAVAVGQSIVEGRAWVGVSAGVFVTLTYVVPAARRVRERAMLSAGDDLVIAHDLGMVLAGLLRRGGIRLDLDRKVCLERRDGSGVAPTEATARPTAAL